MQTMNAPEDTQDAIVEVYKADVCSRDPEVEDVDHELLSGVCTSTAA